MDPPGVACRDLRDCLLYQLRYHQAQLATHKNGNGEATAQVLADAVAIVDQHLRALQNKQYKEIARAIEPARRKQCRRRWTTFALSIRVPVCATTRASPA